MQLKEKKKSFFDGQCIDNKVSASLCILKKISIVAILKSEICFLEIGVLFDEIAISHNDFKNF